MSQPKSSQVLIMKCMFSYLSILLPMYDVLQMKAITSVGGTVDTLHTHEFQLIVCVLAWVQVRFPTS
jgi:hypothetical protein